jgi:hypothetical protein
MTPFGDNVRIVTRREQTDYQDYEIVEERINGTWVERHRYGHQSDDYAMTNSKALARSLATKYIGGH